MPQSRALAASRSTRNSALEMADAFSAEVMFGLPSEKISKNVAQRHSRLRYTI
jgi:hypothetical protein